MVERRTPRRALAIGAVAREAIATYRAYFLPLLVLALVVFTPLGLLEAAMEGVDEIDDEVDELTAIALVAALFGVAITATLGDVFYTGVVAAAVSRRRTGVRHDLAQIARTLPYWRLLAVDVVYALAVAVGLVLLIAPGVVAFGWFGLAAPLVKIERLGVRAALRRSRELVRGCFWRVLAILAPALVAGEALGELLGSGGPWLLGDGFAGEWLGTVLAEALTAPFFALAAVVTAHHLIAARAESASPSGAARGAPGTPPP
jgi:hypothetical protein